MIFKVITLQGNEYQTIDKDGIFMDLSFNDKLEVYLNRGWEMKSDIRFSKNPKSRCMVSLVRSFLDEGHFKQFEEEALIVLEIKRKEKQQEYTDYENAYIEHHKKDRTK